METGHLVGSIERMESQHDVRHARHAHHRNRRRFCSRHDAGGRAHTRQPFGLLHGGASVALAETLGSLAGNLCLDAEKELAVGLDINANHVRAVTHGEVTGTARALHLGRSTQVWEIRIEDEHSEIGLHLASNPRRRASAIAATGRRMSNATTPYAGLSPDVVLAAVESAGLLTDGRLLALNSFENRVYQVGIEDSKTCCGQVLSRRAMVRTRRLSKNTPSR